MLQQNTISIRNRKPNLLGEAGTGFAKDQVATLSLKNSRRRKIYLALREVSWFHYFIFVFTLSAIIILSKFHIVTQNDEQHTESPDQHQIENQLMEYFDRTAIEQANPDSSINKLISLRTSGELQAGFGNIMIGVLAVIMESFVSERFPIINNCIILNMFQHPNPALSFLSYGDADDEINCAFDESQLEKYTPIANAIVNKKQVNNQAVVQDMRKHGVMKKYTDMLEQIDEGDPRLYDMVSSAVARWMMQRPTPLFQRLVNEKKKQVLSQCENATKIDFAIQIRTWRDFKDLMKRGMYTLISGEIEDCIRGRLENLLHKKIDMSNNGAMTSGTKACVYITSDDPMEMKAMVDRMFETKRVNFVISQSASDDAWHSANSFAEHKNKFDPKLLAKHEELIDWMIFGEAEEAIYTVRSTFGRTARMRRGYVGQQNDFVVGMSAPSGVKNDFICNPVQGTDLSLMEWSGHGTLKFKKRKALVLA